MRKLLFIQLIISSSCFGQVRSVYPPVAATVVYATYDPANKGTNITLSGGNLSETSSGLGQVRATKFVSSGVDAVWEISTADCGSGTTNLVTGIDNGSGNVNQYTGQNANTWGAYGGGGILHSGGFVGSGGSGYGVAHVLTMYLKNSTNTLFVYDNGSLLCSVGGLPGGNYYPASGSGGGCMITTANFGATPLTYGLAICPTCQQGVY